MALTTYHGQQDIKNTYLARVQHHRKMDLLQQGATGKPSRGEKGCAVACTMDGYNHAAYPVEIGVPMALAHLEDRIFEGLPKEDAMAWPEQFLEAIPVGVDLWPAIHRITSRILLEVSLPAAKTSGEPEETLAPIVKAIQDASDLQLGAATGKWPSPWKAWQEAWDQEWSKAGISPSAAWSAAWSAARSAAESAAESAAWSAARSAARSAAESAARSAARSAAESAARSAAESAAESAARSAAESAARSAAWSAARSAARSGAYTKMRDITLEELRNA